MTLRQDCELWATFDSEDVDPNRGLVRDRSGKGRTLQASGGPTYGQSAPVGEAVAFDGTDDRFTNNDVSVGGLSTASCAVIVKWNGNDTSNTTFPISVGDAELGLRKRVTSDWQAFTRDPQDGFTTTSAVNANAGDYIVLVGVRDGSRLSLYYGSSVESLTTNGSGIASQPEDGVFIGELDSGNGSFGGDIAFAGVWSRALSDAEIKELNRMTDRMVSKL